MSKGDTGDGGSIPESGRSPGGGTGNAFQYFLLKSPKNREAWQGFMGSQRVGHSWTAKHRHGSCYYNLKSNSWSEVSHKEKNKYSILTIYMESIKMVLMNLFAGKKWRCRHRDRTRGHSTGRKKWVKQRK